MSFTSASVSNKGNQFHIGPSAHFLITVREYALFSISQRVSLLIPVFPTWQKQSALSVRMPTGIECIDVEQVLNSCYKVEKNIILLTIPRIPENIISCSINNIFLRKKLVPCPNKRQAIAIANYNYNVALKYIDSLGRPLIANQVSGPRSQKVMMDTVSGNLEVKLSLECTNLKAEQLQDMSKCPSVAVQPTRVWLE